MRRDCSLVQLEDMLDRNLFIRISKSGIVNLMNVDSYKKGTININGCSPVPLPCLCWGTPGPVH